MAYRKSVDAVLHGVRVVRQKRVSQKTANVFVVVLVDHHTGHADGNTL